jgi:DNA-binding LytR/AlgR family response regulator
MKKCIILDDEQHCIDTLTEYISNTPNLQLLKAFTNPLEAIPFTQNQKIDIAFLDVQMPDLSGLQFLKLLGKDTKVILCTAYSEYAIDGFELEVTDYLLKPVSFERYLRAIQKTEDKTQKTIEIKTNEEEYIFVKADSKLKFTKIKLNDILFIEGYGNYQKIQTIDNQVISNLKLMDLENQLKPAGFMRIHKSFIVNISKICHFETGKLQLGKYEIPIGERFKVIVLESLKDKILG